LRESGIERRTSAPTAIRPPPNITAERRARTARHRAFASFALCAVCLANIAAAAPRSNDWWNMLPDKVLACGIAAVALLILSLLLRGLLKVITLLIVLVLAAGIFWFLRDGTGSQSDTLPHEWTRLAEHTLDSQKSRAAWQSVQSELAKLSSDARARLAAGTDDARRNVVARLEAKAQKLRKEGNAAEADQIARLAAMVEKQK
jgi:hypothetical protein